MTLEQALDGLRDPERREASAAALLERLGELARKRCPGAPPVERDEIVQRVALRLLEWDLSGVTFPGRYVQRMLHNAWIDRLRSEGRQSELAEQREVVWAAHSAGPPPPDGSRAEIDVEAGFRMLIDEALAARAERSRDDLRRDLDQIFQLAAGRVTMQELVAREPAAPPEDSPAGKRVENRLFKRHERARTALLEAVERLEGRGGIGPGDGSELRRLCGLLLRCQRRATAAVSTEGAEP